MQNSCQMRHFKIRFDSVHSTFWWYLNGEGSGYHKRTPFSGQTLSSGIFIFLMTISSLDPFFPIMICFHHQAWQTTRDSYFLSRTLDEDHFSPHRVLLCYFSETWGLWCMTYCAIIHSRKHKKFLPEHSFTAFFPPFFSVPTSQTQPFFRETRLNCCTMKYFKCAHHWRTLDVLLENSRWSGGSSHPVLSQFTLPNWRLITQFRERYNSQSQSSIVQESMP